MDFTPSPTYPTIGDWARDSDYIEISGEWYDRTEVADYANDPSLDLNPVVLTDQYAAAMEAAQS